ncbi:MAG: IPT/TIG domain-containing protein [Vicinamibacteria bacterium]
MSARIAHRILPSGGRRAWRHAALALWASVALAACGDSPNDPTPTPGNQSPTIGSVAPATGTTLGGTTVTVTGTNFAAGATVTIGGTAATNVAVQNATTLTAETPQHAAGAADVSVVVSGRSGSMSSAFTFLAPAASTNQPPAISGISSRSARPGVPNRFADLDETITVTATVIDAETPSDQLKYEWTAESGTFTGTGREVSWRAPAQATTPATVRLTLTVVETYQTVNAQGLPVSAEHRVPGTFDVRLHASAKEVRDMAVDFLVEFSQQRLSPEQIVRNFSDSCPGKSDELRDVRDNQDKRTITSYNVEPNPPVEVAFGGVCRDRGRHGDACAYVPVRWQSTVKATGKPETAIGTDQVNAIYENSRWRLCDSDFIGTTTLDGRISLKPFKK